MLHCCAASTHIEVAAPMRNLASGLKETKQQGRVMKKQPFLLVPIATVNSFPTREHELLRRKCFQVLLEITA